MGQDAGPDFPAWPAATPGIAGRFGLEARCFRVPFRTAEIELRLFFSRYAEKIGRWITGVVAI